MKKNTAQQNPGEVLEELRRAIAENRRQRVRVEGLPPPPDVAIAAVNEKIDRQAELLAHPDSELHRSNTNELLIVIFGPELKQRLSDHIKQAWPKETATDKEKAAQIAELEREQLELELKEEAAAVALERLGVTVYRRGDLNPAVFLEMITPGGNPG